MKRLYTLALSALVLAASATVAVPTMKMVDAKAKKSTQVESVVVAKKSPAKKAAATKRTIAAPQALPNGVARKRAINVNNLGEIKSWQEVSKHFASEINANSSVALPAQPAKTKTIAKAAATPASIDELLEKKWESTYTGMLQSNSGNHEGEATFVYYEEYEELDLVLPDYNQGLYLGYENGNLQIYSSVGYGTNSQGYKIALCPVNTSGQILNQGFEIPFDEATSSFTFPSNFAWALCALDPESGSLVGYFWAAYKFTLYIPEGDFSVEISAPSVCNPENDFKFSVTAGADVAAMKYLVLPFDGSGDTYGNYIAQLGIECVEGQEYTADPFNTVTGAIEESGYACVLVGSYDASGKLRKVAHEAFIVVIPDEEGWQNVGEIDYVDGIISQYYSFPHSQKAMLQAKTSEPGLYRLVNPYSEHEYQQNCGNHHMMLNIADPEWVEMPFCVSGVDFMDGILCFGSIAALGYDKASAQDNGINASGTLEGQTVTFPAKSIYGHEQYYNDPGRWGTINQEAVTFTFPDINLNMTVVNQNGKAVEGATVVLGETSATTDEEGKATIKVPFETGYFATVTPIVNDTEVEVTLNGAETAYTATIETAVDPVEAEVEILPTDFTVEGNSATAVKDGFKAVADKAAGQTAPAYNANSNTLRIYADGTLTVSAKQVTKIVFDLDANNLKKRYTTFTPNVGALTAEQADGDEQITWEGDAASVTFTVGKLGDFGTENTKPGQIHIKKITVYGVAGEEETPDPVVNEVADIKGFLEAADKAHTTTITGEVTVTYQSGKYLFLTDPTGSIEVYGQLENTYANGTKLSGIAGVYSEYNGMPQLTPDATTFTEGTEGDAVEPAEVAAADIELAQYVQLKDVEITEENGKFYVDGVQLYDQFRIEGLEIKAAEKATVTGLGGIYNTTKEIFVTEIVYDETVVPDPERTWTLLEGKGQYAASVMVDYYGADAEPVDVDVYECDQEPGLYKFVGVWPDMMEGGEIIIDATDPNFVIIPVQNTGIIDTVDGPTYIASYTAFNAEDEEAKADMIEYAPEYVITMKDGVITIPLESMFVAWPEAPADSEYETDPEAWYYGNPETAGAAALPGSKIPGNDPFIPGDGDIYNWTSKTLLTNGLSSAEFTITLTDPETGAATISGLPQNFVLNATFDANAGTLTIPNMQDLGTDSYGDQNYFYIKGIDDDYNVLDGASAQAATVGVIKGDVITFPTFDIWAIGDPDNEDLGWWLLTYTNVLTKQTPEDPDKDPNEGWTSMGEATLMDGWVMTCFGFDQKDPENWYTVELQKNNENENIYRLVEPYKGNCPLAQYNQSTKRGYIQFDVTDPDHVVFDVVDAGFAYAAAGLNSVYCYNKLGFYVAYYEESAETVVAVMGDEMPYTTFKDGVISLGSIETYDDDGNAITEYDACFGTNGANGAYGWIDNDDNSINMEAKIWFPGVTPSLGEDDAIKEITAAEGEEVIFNLRGQRINNATVPGIYIRNNQKVLVK